ncbi:MAG: hypothetical protein GXP32_07970 [Kiritimatiellaeota bacterium]|nr:hypothetical protein [Kiritimatiellota bacterium]
MKRTIDSFNSRESKESRLSFGMVMAILLTLALHATFLLFKKAPPPLAATSAPPPMVALLPLNPTSKTELGLLKWLGILDPKCFIKPNRVCGFSLGLSEDSVNDTPFVERTRKPSFRFSASSPLPSPTETEQERLRKLWRYVALPISPTEPRVAIPTSEYPLWLLEDGSRLPQLFPDSSAVRSLVKTKPPPLNETVLKTRFFDGDFFPTVVLECSCGDQELDMAAIKTLTFRGAALGLRAKSDESPVFISVKWR